MATSSLIAPDQFEDSVASALEPLRLHLLAVCEASGDSPPDPFRGLHLAHPQVLEGLSGGVVTLATTTATRSVANGLRGLRTGALLADLYDLTDFELAVVALALAPEVAPGFATAVAWLQDDLTRRLPTSSLALQLFCCDPPDPDETRIRLSLGAPLFARRLLSLPAVSEPLPTRALVLDVIWRYNVSQPAGVLPHPPSIVTTRRSPCDQRRVDTEERARAGQLRASRSGNASVGP